MTSARTAKLKWLQLAVIMFFPAVALLFLFAPTSKGRREAYKIYCHSKLRQIYGMAMGYADTNGTFPIGPGEHPRAHESLNELIRSEEGFPYIFLCPEAEAVTVDEDMEHHYILRKTNLSYAWVAEKTKTTAWNRPLASDKYVDGDRDAGGMHRGHPDGMNVLMTDGSVRFVKRSDLPPSTLLPEGLTR